MIYVRTDDFKRYLATLSDDMRSEVLSLVYEHNYSAHVDSSGEIKFTPPEYEDDILDYKA